MKKGLMLILLGAVAMSAVAPAWAQDDYTLFSREAGAASLLYRGQKAFAYNMLYNGTYYWNSPDFRKGRVLYDGKGYDDLLLNVDAARQDLLGSVSSISRSFTAMRHRRATGLCSMTGRSSFSVAFRKRWNRI